ncbi:hypothetical protein BDA99DRAFT_513411 [Phascolomyces articulosus]|uniref:Uncharacterized protein n=1 Tax=Phascolomyces articulosus TaxID=60185 RepID=A0AAD5K7U6_9FUNG|nr:hypothetical protein BDA99DRAFT_513411 [Phascolomyces articulosus]
MIIEDVLQQEKISHVVPLFLGWTSMRVKIISNVLPILGNSTGGVTFLINNTWSISLFAFQSELP